MTRTPTALALLLALTGSAAAAPPARPRVVRARYQHPSLGDPAYVFGFCWTVHRPTGPTENHGCVRLQPGRGERRLELSIRDDTGLPVYANAVQDADRDGRPELDEYFCGATEPLPIVDAEVLVWVLPGPRPDCTSMATAGVVTGTFHRS